MATFTVVASGNAKTDKDNLQNAIDAMKVHADDASVLSLSGTFVFSNTPPDGTWTPTTVYLVGDQGKKYLNIANGNIYTLVTAGTSGAQPGPQGTGTGIADGTCTWDWFANARICFGRDSGSVKEAFPKGVTIQGATATSGIKGGIVPIFVALDQTHDCTIQNLVFGGTVWGDGWIHRAVFVGQARNCTVKGLRLLLPTGKRYNSDDTATGRSYYLNRNDNYRGSAFGLQKLDATISLGSTLAGTGAFKNRIVGDILLEDCYIDYETLPDSAADPTGQYATMALARANADWFTMPWACSAAGPTSTLTVRGCVAKNFNNIGLIGNEHWSEMVTYEDNYFEMASFEAKHFSSLKPLLPFPGSSGAAIHIWTGKSYSNPLNLGNYVVRNNKIVLNGPWQIGIGVTCHSNPYDVIASPAALDNTTKAISIVGNEIIMKHASCLAGIGLYQADGCYVGQNVIRGTGKFAMVEGVNAVLTGADRNTFVGNDVSGFASSLSTDIAMVAGPDAADGVLQSSTRAVWLNDSSARMTVSGFDQYEGAVPSDVTAVLNYLKTGWAVLPDARP